MKFPQAATRVTALGSGVLVGLGLPGAEAAAQMLGLSSSAQQLVFFGSLVLFFFVPFLLFVVGVPHLASGPKDILTRGYWGSLGGVAFRSAVWLVGAGLGFAILAAVRPLN